ncbi:MAG: hypothetical protein K1X67_26065 [Fimbriimonadaceae bacterium]|nr:hypothetical protein [Fimbriimonadaceae bacterium]
MTPTVEPTMIGLSEKSHELLKRLKVDEHFSEMADAYRFGVALALARGISPGEVPAPRTTIFSVATIDPNGDLATAIRSILDLEGGSVYRMAERLAEWGVQEIGRQAESGEVDVVSLMDEAGVYSTSAT